MAHLTMLADAVARNESAIASAVDKLDELRAGTDEAAVAELTARIEASSEALENATADPVVDEPVEDPEETPEDPTFEEGSAGFSDENS